MEVEEGQEDRMVGLGQRLAEAVYGKALGDKELRQLESELIV